MTTTAGPPNLASVARRWLIASIASGLAAFGIVAALALYFARPAAPQSFTAVAQITLIDRDISELRGPLFEQVDTTPGISDASYAAVKTLRSRMFVEQVARDLGLLPAAKAETGTNFFEMMAGAVDQKQDPQQKAVVDALLASLSVIAREDSIIDVRFSATDAGEAIRGANRVAERFRDDQTPRGAPPDAALTTGFTQELSVLEEEEKRLSADVTAAKGHPIDDDGSGQAALDAHEAARLEVAAAEAGLNRSRDLILAGEAHRLLDPGTSTLARYLVDARGSIQRLLDAQKDPGSPRGQQLAADLAGIDNQIARQAQQITEKQQLSVETAKEREAALAKVRGDVQVQQQSLSRSAAALAKVRAAIEAKRTELRGLVSADNPQRGGAFAGPVRLALAHMATADDTEFGRKAAAVAAGLLTALVGLAAFGIWTYAGASRSASTPLSYGGEPTRFSDVEANSRRPQEAERTRMARSPGRSSRG